MILHFLHNPSANDTGHVTVIKRTFIQVKSWDKLKKNTNQLTVIGDIYIWQI